MRKSRSDSKLVAFLYLLLRDEMTAGSLEAIVTDLDLTKGPYTLSNGYVAGHAMDLAKRLK